MNRKAKLMTQSYSYMLQLHELFVTAIQEEEEESVLEAQVQQGRPSIWTLTMFLASKPFKSEPRKLTYQKAKLAY